MPCLSKVQIDQIEKLDKKVKGLQSTKEIFFWPLLILCTAISCLIGGRETPERLATTLTSPIRGILMLLALRPTLARWISQLDKLENAVGFCNAMLANSPPVSSLELIYEKLTARFELYFDDVDLLKPDVVSKLFEDIGVTALNMSVFEWACAGCKFVHERFQAMKTEKKLEEARERAKEMHKLGKKTRKLEQRARRREVIDQLRKAARVDDQVKNENDAPPPNKLAELRREYDEDSDSDSDSDSEADYKFLSLENAKNQTIIGSAAANKVTASMAANFFVTPPAVVKKAGDIEKTPDCVDAEAVFRDASASERKSQEISDKLRALEQLKKEMMAMKTTYGREDEDMVDLADDEATSKKNNKMGKKNNKPKAKGASKPKAKGSTTASASSSSSSSSSAAVSSSAISKLPVKKTAVKKKTVKAIEEK
ncbi:unnamed protein product [Amoebophrya sp. A25]|nr:unnamed protein product [Amoebophrya sp. A25]|eukprot:GSA25T00026691001.1